MNKSKLNPSRPSTAAMAEIPATKPHDKLLTGCHWKETKKTGWVIETKCTITIATYDKIKATGQVSMGLALGVLADAWNRTRSNVAVEPGPSASVVDDEPAVNPEPAQPAADTPLQRGRSSRVAGKWRSRDRQTAWHEAQEAAEHKAKKAKGTAHTPKPRPAQPPPPTTPKPINPLAPTTAQSTPTMTTSCGKCTPQLVTIGHHSCSCNHSTQPQTFTDQPKIIDLTQPANRPAQPPPPHRPTDSPKPNRRFRRVSDIAKVARAIRTNRTKHTDAAVANLVNCLSRDQSKKGKTISAAVRKATAARVRKHRKSTAIIQHFEEAVLTFNSAHPEDPISMGEVCSIWTLRHDAKLESLIHSSPEFEKLKTAWTDEGIETLLDAMHMSPDECLLLKEKMMVSYAGWDEMRKTAGMQYAEGAYNLKQLAKDYNSVLNDKLGFEAVADGKGYRVSLKSLHFWVVEQAIAGGFVDPAKVPRTIQYKESMDGSNLGSRNAELVAICPMNLGK